MSFIQVPIGKGITKFPNIKRSQPETIPKSEDATNTLQFLHDLVDDGEIRSQVDSTTLSGTATSFTPNNGDTYFPISVTVGNSSASTELVEIINASSIPIVFIVPTLTQLKYDLTSERLVGNGTDSFSVNLVNARSSIHTVQVGYVKKTKRIS